MGKGKHKGKKPRDQAYLGAQRARTRRNKIKRYTALIEKEPSHPHRKIWENKREGAQQV